MDINLNLLKSFVAVAELKNYAKASDKIHISKTAISKNIKQLENAFDTQLFYRESGGVRLTKEGTILYEYVKNGLNSIEAGKKMLLDRNSLENGKLVIGSMSHISTFYLMDKIEKVMKDYPSVQIKLVTKSRGIDLIKALEEHEIDFAIDSTIMKIKNEDIKRETLFKTENIFISNEPLEIKNVDDFSKYNLIIGSPTTNRNQELLAELKKHNLNIEQRLDIDITELKIEAVKRGLGLGYVMKSSVQKELDNKEVFEVKIPFELPMSEINLIYLKNQLTVADKKFIKNYLK